MNRNEVVHLSQEPRKALHLIEDHPGFRWAGLNGGPKQPWILQQRQIVPIQQEIEPQRIPELLAQPSRFARATRTEKEKRVIGQLQKTCIHRGHFTMESARTLCIQGNSMSGPQARVLVSGSRSGSAVRSEGADRRSASPRQIQ